MKSAQPNPRFSRTDVAKYLEIETSRSNLQAEIRPEYYSSAESLNGPVRNLRVAVLGRRKDGDDTS